ncbi:hypothetical protein EV379_1305 [Microterricola gilva]|uniref:DUF5671 domain-containing protein n=1 Tax=Microterricola gilva TaxID=393267 RepID=A0A4Q8ALQ1_9MICO|nr:DUF5671 domain-containing protein [Microterricola gilva]RZU64991.1 hypothetical protein EV379_1305 [Microterricola gilva]
MANTAGSAQRTVRRAIVYTLLFVLVTVAGIGMSGLLGRVFEAGSAIASGGSSALAQSLAFTVIGAPLAALLWWWLWRRLDDAEERSALTWGLYVAAMYLVSLIVFTVSTVDAAQSMIRGSWEPATLASAIVWFGIWLAHRAMSRNADRGPLRLATVPVVLGAFYGLVAASSGAVSAFGVLLDNAIRGVNAVVLAGEGVFAPLSHGLLWLLVGGVIWWLHWVHGGAARVTTGLASVMLIWVAVLGGSLLSLSGVGISLFVLLRLAFDRGEPIGVVTDPLGEAIAAALVGAVVWRYHWLVTRERSAGVQRASSVVVSGVGMAATASGIGVIINALLATLSTSLAGSDSRTLLLGGLSAFLVGGVVWWFTWKPVEPVSAAEQRDTSRRVYLVAMFGLSAIVALIALLIVGYGVFVFALDSTTGTSLIEQVRAPLGLLIATAAVFGYHFSVWRRDRAAVALATPVRVRTIGEVILVTDAASAPQRKLIEELTGASVTTWVRADAPGESPGAASPGLAEERLSEALNGVTAARLLVITGADGAVQLVPLAE